MSEGRKRTSTSGGLFDLDTFDVQHNTEWFLLTFLMKLTSLQNDDGDILLGQLLA